MITLMCKNKINFCADKHNIDEVTGEYKDPLMRWPLRGASFTNEVGEVLRPLIGNYANWGWAPVLMYIGADIYDKYKNNEDEYSPSSERCLKQAIYQGVSTLLLPVISSRLGQQLFAQIGRFSSEELSINPQVQISKIADNFIMNGKLQNIEGKEKDCTEEFLKVVHNTIDFKKQEQDSKNPFKYLLHKAEEVISYALGINNTEKIHKYGERTIKDLIELQKKLDNPTDEVLKSNWYKCYIEYQELGQTKNIAAMSVLKDFQKSKMLKGKLLMTFGGLVAVIATVKPIDKLVDNYIFGKVINPGFKEIEKIEIKNLKSKLAHKLNQTKPNIDINLNDIIPDENTFNFLS